MKHEALYYRFVEEITRKIPQKTAIVNTLAEILNIDKEVISNKLQSEIPFTFDEAMKISRQLGISLDNLEISTSSILKPSKFRQIEYINPAESDFALLKEMTKILKSFKKFPDPEAGEITNILPQPLYLTYEYISRFYLFNWKYQSNRQNKPTPYKDIIISDKLKKAQNEYVKWAKILHAEYIFDRLLFHYLVTEIKYFYYIGLITNEDILLIKQDLLKILEEIDTLSCTGFFKETGKSVNIYVSDVNISTNYIYVATPDYQLTIIKAFIINGIASTDKQTFEELKSWMKSVKQQSTLITRCGDKDRIDFIEKQQRIIESLSQL
ncbi:MAG: hypothetical protein LBV74_08925 [Tannerella sp.]|jgi:hypothetical protein|nr:hypothetical protein [Tannerella sp.]